MAEKTKKENDFLSMASGKPQEPHLWNKAFLSGQREKLMRETAMEYRGIKLLENEIFFLWGWYYHSMWSCLEKDGWHTRQVEKEHTKAYQTAKFDNVLLSRVLDSNLLDAWFWNHEFK